jgi:uncharacterized membrane protein YhaH (DUF805 family)
MTWWIQCWRKYAVFQGRAPRREYWSYVLVTVLAQIACAFLDAYLGTRHPTARFGLVGGIYALIALLPTLAVTIRRLHDTGRSAWYLLIVLIPLLGAVVLLVLLAQRSESGTNSYGVQPPSTP